MTPVAAEVSVASAREGAGEVAAAPATKAAGRFEATEAATCAMPPPTENVEEKPQNLLAESKPPPPPPSPRHAWLVVLAGPCGSGKTTVGRALSELLGGLPFLDADDYHDAAAKKKMSEGRPLDDGDRLPWLARVAAASRDAAAFSPSHVAVLACSALKKRYRDLLDEVANEASVPSVRVDFVLLRAKKESLRARLERRLQRSSGSAEEVAGHFLHPSLLDSQIEAWEDSEEVVVVDNDAEGGESGGGGKGGGGADAAAAARRTAEAVKVAVGL